MKRALTLTLTVALIGGLAFMGLAGTAAAQPQINPDVNSSVDIDQDSSATTTINNDQSNSNSQTQLASSYASSDTSYAKTVAYQSQDVDQNNVNVVDDVYTISANQANDNDANSTGIDTDVDIDFDELPL
ncbi:hypothetical protein [Natrinema gari]|uniref:Uncharacterized protein n=1 Tax=Natrinema gari JCM 14663 TaxID=1230459 RepID=L9ZAU7_9EURY|nr:hypothetical protein [Natrinema gari]ELY82283.1 hypothetical protein C486_04840 [Natrinema gari JCM 14663]